MPGQNTDPNRPDYVGKGVDPNLVGAQGGSRGQPATQPLPASSPDSPHRFDNTVQGGFVADSGATGFAGTMQDITGKGSKTTGPNTDAYNGIMNGAGASAGHFGQMGDSYKQNAPQISNQFQGDSRSGIAGNIASEQGLAGYNQGIMNGGDTAAQAQLRSATDQSIAANMAMAHSAGGGAVGQAGAQRQAQQQGATTLAAASAQSAALRSQEAQAAAGRNAQLYGQIGGQQQSQYGLEQGSAEHQGDLSLGSQGQQNSMRLGLYGQQNSAADRQLGALNDYTKSSMQAQELQAKKDKDASDSGGGLFHDIVGAASSAANAVASSDINAKTDAHNEGYARGVSDTSGQAPTPGVQGSGIMAQQVNAGPQNSTSAAPPSAYGGGTPVAQPTMQGPAAGSYYGANAPAAPASVMGPAAFAPAPPPQSPNMAPAAPPPPAPKPPIMARAPAATGTTPLAPPAAAPAGAMMSDEHAKTQARDEGFKAGFESASKGGGGSSSSSGGLGLSQLTGGIMGAAKSAHAAHVADVAKQDAHAGALYKQDNALAMKAHEPHVAVTGQTTLNGAPVMSPWMNDPGHAVDVTGRPPQGQVFTDPARMPSPVIGNPDVAPSDGNLKTGTTSEGDAGIMSGFHDTPTGGTPVGGTGDGMPPSDMGNGSRFANELGKQGAEDRLLNPHGTPQDRGYYESNRTGNQGDASNKYQKDIATIVSDETKKTGIMKDKAPSAKAMAEHSSRLVSGERVVLPADKEKAFQAWAAENKIRDVDHPDSHYDYRGAYSDGLKAGPDAHWPDTYKQHGHPTFSVESNYSKGSDDGGHWDGDTYVPQSAVASSDKNGKTGIMGGHTSAGKPTLADKFMDGLHPASYVYKDTKDEPGVGNNPGGRYLGIMAQDAEKIPEIGRQLVVDTPRGKMVQQKPMLSAAVAGLARLNERMRVLESEKGKRA